jgi:hypothetical protein
MAKSKMRRINLFPQNELDAQKNARNEWISELKGTCRVQAAAEENRGGGERGSNELTEFRDEGSATNASKSVEDEAVRGAGSTKMAGATAGRSGLWQQDMLHCAIVAISCPQSMACSGWAGV